MKVIASLEAELNETRSMEVDCEHRLEKSRGEVCRWKEEVKEQKAEVGKLKHRVRRSDATVFMSGKGRIDT